MKQALLILILGSILLKVDRSMALAICGWFPTAVIQILPSPLNIHVGDPVMLNAGNSTPGSNNYIKNYKYNFGDGFIRNSKKSDLTHIYKKPGTYTLMLNVYDSCNTKSNTAHQTVTVIPKQPILNFALGASTVNIQNPVRLVELEKTYASQLTIDWGDASVPEVKSVALGKTYGPLSHIYAQPGIYTIAMQGFTDPLLTQNTRTVTVTDQPVAPIVQILNLTDITNIQSGRVNTLTLKYGVTDDSRLSNITISWGDGSKPQIIKGKSVYSGSGKATEYLNGVQVNERTIKHTYSRADIYQVVVSGMDDQNNASAVETFSFQRYNAPPVFRSTWTKSLSVKCTSQGSTNLCDVVLDPAWIYDEAAFLLKKAKTNYRIVDDGFVSKVEITLITAAGDLPQNCDLAVHQANPLRALCTFDAADPYLSIMAEAVNGLAATSPLVSNTVAYANARIKL